MEGKKDKQDNSYGSSFSHAGMPDFRPIKAQIFSLFKALAYTKEAPLKLQALFVRGMVAVTS
jgi:hypothetical protein